MLKDIYELGKLIEQDDNYSDGYFQVLTRCSEDDKLLVYNINTDNTPDEFKVIDLSFELFKKSCYREYNGTAALTPTFRFIPKFKMDKIVNSLKFISEMEQSVLTEEEKTQLEVLCKCYEKLKKKNQSLSEELKDFLSKNYSKKSQLESIKYITISIDNEIVEDEFVLLSNYKTLLQKYCKLRNKTMIVKKNKSKNTCYCSCCGKQVSIDDINVGASQALYKFSKLIPFQQEKHGMTYDYSLNNYYKTNPVCFDCCNTIENSITYIIENLTFSVGYNSFFIVPKIINNNSDIDYLGYFYTMERIRKNGINNQEFYRLVEAFKDDHIYFSLYFYQPASKYFFSIMEIYDDISYTSLEHVATIASKYSIQTKEIQYSIFQQLYFMCKDIGQEKLFYYYFGKIIDGKKINSEEFWGMCLKYLKNAEPKFVVTAVNRVNLISKFLEELKLMED